MRDPYRDFWLAIIAIILLLLSLLFSKKKALKDQNGVTPEDMNNYAQDLKKGVEDLAEMKDKVVDKMTDPDASEEEKEKALKVLQVIEDAEEVVETELKETKKELEQDGYIDRVVDSTDPKTGELTAETVKVVQLQQATMVEAQQGVSAERITPKTEVAKQMTPAVAVARDREPAQVATQRTGEPESTALHAQLQPLEAQSAAMSSDELLKQAQKLSEALKNMSGATNQDPNHDPDKLKAKLESAAMKLASAMKQFADVATSNPQLNQATQGLNLARLSESDTPDTNMASLLEAAKNVDVAMKSMIGPMAGKELSEEDKKALKEAKDSVDTVTQTMVEATTTVKGATPGNQPAKLEPISVQDEQIEVPIFEPYDLLAAAERVNNALEGLVVENNSDSAAPKSQDQLVPSAVDQTIEPSKPKSPAVNTVQNFKQKRELSPKIKELVQFHEEQIANQQSPDHERKTGLSSGR